jgi:hypothetical protein
MEIQTPKSGKCSLTLDASRIIWGAQQTDFSPDATMTPPTYQQLAISSNEIQGRLPASVPGDLIHSSQPTPP